MIVTTSSGPVGGVTADSGIVRFLGIPYAAAPVDALRFQPPTAPASWVETRDATTYGPTPPQAAGSDPGWQLVPNVEIPGDDVLNLNIWTPLVAGALPVMVFIPGGAFSTGSGSVPLYDGSTFARDGIVLVTINYRLHVDGFFWTGDGTPNLGMLDQVAALEWVRDNIRAFGGDPDNVTIFGESAGAMSVCTLMVMPRAKGLFHRAIAESGAGVSVISPESARKIGTRLAKILEVEPTRQAVGAVSMERVLEAVAQVGDEVVRSPLKRKWGDVAKNLMAFEPIVDGDIVPGVPEQLISRGASRDVHS